MTIEINDRIIGIWFVELPKGDNWIAGLSKHESGSGYLLQWRFRYRKDDKAFDSEDEKSWWRAEMSAEHPQDAVIEIVRNMAGALAITAGTHAVFETLMGPGGARQFAEDFKKMPFAQVKEEPLH